MAISAGLWMYFNNAPFEEGDTYTINVVVKGIDLGSELKELSYEDFPQADDEDALNDYLLSIIENCEIIKSRLFLPVIFCRSKVFHSVAPEYKD